MQNGISKNRIGEIVDTLTARHQIERVILFGSQSRGDANRDSDLDLFLIMNFEGNRRKLMVEMRDLFANIRHGIDILIAKPDEYEEDKLIPGTLARQVFLEGRVVYDGQNRIS
ncbi:nucleotidyltransferase domain-containing protein [Desulfonatronum thioautotrophicum]|uniref:nucleotidyltransferase domain-containing protein n=1 Tax=Desulfonatronum thioautotrophicum TaxID=617001 RepID=UPI0005EB27CC|nr:nucleotidyltransferase domain-containing protein [Desulfonatronum thioautotrophicum]